MLAFVYAAQVVLPWTSSTEEPPKKADLKGWVDHICAVALPGPTQEQRRHLVKTLLEDAWKFANWLTHSKTSHWHDAEAAIEVSENAIGLCTSAVIRHIGGVPDQCPACGSQRLSPERGYHVDHPDDVWERPSCDKCGWVGDAIRIEPLVQQKAEVHADRPKSECVIPTVPLRHLVRPERKT
jgi:hypothetical protein